MTIKEQIQQQYQGKQNYTLVNPQGQPQARMMMTASEAAQRNKELSAGWKWQ